MNAKLEEKLARLPDSPGVYIMRDRVGTVIYVGKAISLKNRVRQYFQSSRGHPPKVQAMVDRVEDFDTVLVNSELEALILECNLIKHYRPRYNIMLRDDKQYPYVRVDMRETFPRVGIVRRIGEDGARYFGPYIGAHALRDAMDSVKRIFPIRTCRKDIQEGGRDRPCLNAAIGQCLAPCAGRVSREEYLQVVNAACSFLQGHTDDVIPLFRQRMDRAAENLEYEKAALYRDRIRTLERVLQKQQAADPNGADQDMVGLVREGNRALLLLLRMREGKMLDPISRLIEGVEEESDAQLLGTLLMQHYMEETSIPREVLLPETPEDAPALEQYLGDRRGGRVYLRVPQRGDKKKLVEMARSNAADDLRNAIERDRRAYERTVGAVLQLQQILDLPEPPRRIEAYDNSNFHGTDPVSSMVVFHDGAPAKKEYRRFRVKTVVGADDFRTMGEIITRRFTHGLEERTALLAEGKDPDQGKFSHLPDLVLIDGGRGQLGYALAAMRATGAEVPMIGLAKEWEEIWQEGAEEPIRLPKHSEALQLLQRVRDEAHRFAITYHRSLRGKRGLLSRLETLPGIGPQRRRALMRHFPTLEALRRAELEEIAGVKGMTRAAAQVVYDFLQAENAPDRAPES